MKNFSKITKKNWKSIEVLRGNDFLPESSAGFIKSGGIYWIVKDEEGEWFIDEQGSQHWIWCTLSLEPTDNHIDFKWLNRWFKIAKVKK